MMVLRNFIIPFPLFCTFYIPSGESGHWSHSLPPFPTLTPPPHHTHHGWLTAIHSLALLSRGCCHVALCRWLSALLLLFSCVIGARLSVARKVSIIALDCFVCSSGTRRFGTLLGEHRSWDEILTTCFEYCYPRREAIQRAIPSIVIHGVASSSP